MLVAWPRSASSRASGLRMTPGMGLATQSCCALSMTTFWLKSMLSMLWSLLLYR